MTLVLSMVDDYLNAVDEKRLPYLLQIREMLTKPELGLTETMQYKLPTYSKNGEVYFAFANQKNYMAFYVCHYDLLNKFKEKLSKFNCGKSCIRFKQLAEEDLSLFKEIIEYVNNNLENSAFYGKYKANS